MRTHLDCIPCFVRQSLDAARSVSGDKAIIEALLRDLLTEISRFDFELSPPEMGQIIHRIVRQKVNHPDPYREIKQRSTQRALEKAPVVRRRIDASDTPFETALRLSIAGNILDFALAHLWSQTRIEDSLDLAAEKDMDISLIRQLQKEIDQAETILFLGDNAGETVFDRLFIEQFPGKAKVFYAVKGGPVINDATRQDALAAGLDTVAEIIENGSDAPGTVLSQTSEAFRSLYDTADVVIAKGQANFETLNEAHRRIYFLTQMKCPTIADSYGYCQGDWVVVTSGKFSDGTEATIPGPFKLAVASGKGGTGKTTLSVALALAAAQTDPDPFPALAPLQPVALLDCDVEEPNAHLFLDLQKQDEQPVCIRVPHIDTSRCNACGKCAAFCQFNALACLPSGAMTFPELCHGCGGCMKICPEQAISESDHRIGSVTRSGDGYPILVTGRLDIGQPMAPPVIRDVCKQTSGNGLTIIDAPPGTACAMVAAVHDADFVLLVTEPTPFGLNDLKLAVDTVRDMDKPFAVVVNRAGPGRKECPVEAYCRQEDISVALRIPDDRRMAEAYSRGQTLLDVFPDIHDRLEKLLLDIRFVHNGKSAAAPVCRLG